jgi:hypothetical protein
MKKISVLLVVVLISAAVSSQEGNLKKQFYFRLGASVPTWRYYGNDGKTDFSEGTKRIGGIFEVGSIYMLNGIQLAEGMRLGINVDYLSVWVNRFTYNGGSPSTNFAYLGSKVGPSFSYSPVNHLVFDAYVKFNPVWASMNYLKFGDENTEDELFFGFMGIKYSVGFNVRYSLLMMGFEFNPGFSKLRYYNKDENKLTSDYLGNTNNENDKTPVPCINITLGLSF